MSGRNPGLCANTAGEIPAHARCSRSRTFLNTCMRSCEKPRSHAEATAKAPVSSHASRPNQRFGDARIKLKLPIE
eukprot:1212661-Pleurochrysis_carterae.AAC.1